MLLLILIPCMSVRRKSGPIIFSIFFDARFYTANR